MNNLKSFFKTTKYEYIRVGRNKMLTVLLVSFAVIVLFFMSFVTIDKKSLIVAIHTDGLQVEEYEAMGALLKESKNTKFIYVDSEKEGKDLVIKQKAIICISFQSEENPVRATLFYDSRTAFGRTVKNTLQDHNTDYMYETLVGEIKELGVTIKQSFFDRTDFVSATDCEIDSKQMMYSTAVGICLAIILTFGLAYSIARDNETNVSRNVAYTPISINKYLFSKILVYISLGILEILICMLLGWAFFGIKFAMNVPLIAALTIFFIIAVVNMGLMFSLIKSQISSTLMSMIFILVPMLMLTMGHMATLPIILQIILNCSPITPFINFFNCLIFDNIILWENVLLFGVQSVVFYLITYFVLKRRVGK